ncbi:hypothetical protein SBA2_450147 [Acidobacteriia bacterium SbA2]|nr:hypothetical protein SBA2_450147 [Acidobacteriia bacterium SbA2]
MGAGGLLSSKSQGSLFRSGQELAAEVERRASTGVRPLHYEPIKFIQPTEKAGPVRGELKSPPHRPWTLPAHGLALFHGDQDAARLSHYFFPRLLLEGKRILMLDGANCADPRLLERMARQRGVPFEQFCRQIEIARAFTCFQLTELIARLPRLLTDFPSEIVIVTAFPELYYDEDVRDWDAQVAFEQALANLRRLAGSGEVPRTGTPWRAPTVALFSSATTFAPSPARRRFFEKVSAAGSEVWQFRQNAEGRLGLVCSKRIATTPAPSLLRRGVGLATPLLPEEGKGVVS